MKLEITEEVMKLIVRGGFALAFALIFWMAEIEPAALFAAMKVALR